MNGHQNFDDFVDRPTRRPTYAGDMTMRVLSLSLLMMSSTLYAQTTWKGLKFGMNRIEVVKTIPDYQLTPISDTQMLSKVDFILNPAGMNAYYPFTVRTNFDAGGRLDIVMLNLDTADMVRQKKSNDEGAAVALAVFGLDTQFAAKYGAPSKVEGNCAEIEQAYASHQTQFCSKTWGADGQSVSFYWTMSPTRPVLGIQYQALPDL